MRERETDLYQYPLTSGMDIVLNKRVGYKYVLFLFTNSGTLEIN